MNVLLIGTGGREHALAEAITRSSRLDKLFCMPGSDALAEMAECVDLSPSDSEGVVRFIRDVGVELTVVGPEAPLVAGLRDDLEAEGLRVFGPRKDAAALEGSKVFTKNLLRKYRIPCATSRTFEDARQALAWIGQQGEFPVVIKADGLAAGKGVIIAEELAAAEAALERMLVRREFGDAGSRVIVEEFLVGEEVSILAFTDGHTIAPLEAARDHKAAFDGDAGPNTGGMGAFSPSPLVTPEVYQQVESQVLLPIVHAMNRERRPYQGVLYAGLMVTEAGPKVLEFNVRFGDPEAQVILPRLKTDFLDIAERTCEQRLEEIGSLEFDPRPALVVVLASEGYPGKPITGRPISGLPRAAEVEGVTLFHSGTRRREGQWVTAGGRVLGVTARGDTIEEARRQAYLAVSHIEFEGMHYRRDIGVARGEA